ncbi:quinolinate synthase NadA [Methylobacterium nonmethylotrophicum]|uniref:Quinolinate synthase n=1 Tax=Methylobacterium nonmethylotrophicum TaxID=1141884 RepID=A0A4Z0NXD2_9HYPH|nr:quinolinate synthase NadA [Methylobacterium nonmethylotrophicum]TGE02325.1 quinolinate synthase NadA [Methylobacterium nonmethylotrophicum]
MDAAIREAGERLPLADIHARVRHHVPAAEWPALAGDVAAIQALKRARNAVVLAHNYQAPEIVHTVADIVGDSLALAREAARTDADVIVLAGVHFMAETAKILNPDKTVLIPDPAAGCSLADSITAADVRDLRRRYPGVPVVTYVNTSAAVKAESDICCTSGNAKAVVESLGAKRVLMIPDEYLAQNVQAELPGIEILTWAGHCEVHERFTAADIREAREAYPGVTVLAHPECPPAVVAEADFAGSTAAMQAYVEARRPAQVVMITECAMADNLAIRNPDVAFVKPCNLCPHMKRITLGKIRRSLETLTHEVTVPDDLIAPARRAVARMLAVRA